MTLVLNRKWLRKATLMNGGELLQVFCDPSEHLFEDLHRHPPRHRFSPFGESRLSSEKIGGRRLGGHGGVDSRSRFAPPATRRRSRRGVRHRSRSGRGGTDRRRKRHPFGAPAGDTCALSATPRRRTHPPPPCTSACTSPFPASEYLRTGHPRIEGASGEPAAPRLPPAR